MSTKTKVTEIQDFIEQTLNPCMALYDAYNRRSLSPSGNDIVRLGKATVDAGHHLKELLDVVKELNAKVVGLEKDLAKAKANAKPTAKRGGTKTQTKTEPESDKS